MSLTAQNIFEISDGADIWVQSYTTKKDSNILVTISNPKLEESFLINELGITPTHAKHYVEAPPE